MLIAARLRSAKPGDDADGDEGRGKAQRASSKQLVQQMLDNAAICRRGEQGIARAVDALRASPRKLARASGRWHACSIRNSARRMAEVLRGQQGQTRQAVLTDYTAMQTAEPVKDVLHAFVGAHFSGRREGPARRPRRQHDASGSGRLLRHHPARQLAALSNFLSGSLPRHLCLPGGPALQLASTAIRRRPRS